MKELLLYVGNVLAIAIPLACFEIWLERFKSGWCGEFFHPFWGRKIRWRWLCRLFEKTYVTPYHLIMFGPVIMGISAVEYILLARVGRGWLIAAPFGVTIVPPLFLTAVWAGNTVIEDFLYFALQRLMAALLLKPPFPDALERFFRGEFTWHTKWLRLGPRLSLPLFYFTTWYVVAALIAAERLIIRLAGK